MRGRGQRRADIRVGEHHPLEFAEVSPAGFRGTEVDQALDLGLPVGGAEVDVHAVLARGGVVDLLERQPGAVGHRHDDEKRWCDGIYLPVERTGPPVGELLGSVVSIVMFSVLSAMRRPYASPVTSRRDHSRHYLPRN